MRRASDVGILWELLKVCPGEGAEQYCQARQRSHEMRMELTTKLRSLMTLARVFSRKEIKRETEKSLSAFEKFCFEWRPRKGIIAEEGLDSNFFKIHFDVWLTYNTIHQSGVYRSMSFDRCAWVPPQSRCRTFHHIKNFFLFPLISLSSPDLGNHSSAFCHYKWDVSF